jgi:serine/threonine protein kinase
VSGDVLRSSGEVPSGTNVPDSLGESTTMSVAGEDSSEVPAHAPRASRIVDCTYFLYDKLAEGGMGAVYRARRRVGGAEVALKLVGAKEQTGSSREQTSETSAFPLDFRLALAREFQMLSSLHHPHVIQVLDYGFDEALGPYFTMELLATPRTILEAGAGLPLGDKVHLLAQVLRALAYVHRRGIVHRDLKPSNILCVDGVVKVLDFGLATSTPSTAKAAGTLSYMAPELLAGQPPSAMSDLFSVGMIAAALVARPIHGTGDSTDTAESTSLQSPRGAQHRRDRRPRAPPGLRLSAAAERPCG